MTLKNVLMTIAAPSRSSVVAAGVVLRGDGTPPEAVYDHFCKLVTIAKWADERGIDSFADWSQVDADRFLEDLRAGERRAGGAGIGTSGIRGYVRSLRLLRECHAVVPDALTFFPWTGLSASQVGGEVARTENATPPLPWKTWAPLVAASWVIVDRFSVDIIAAVATRAALPREPRGPAGANAYRVLLEWEEEKGLVPLHTGYGRTRHQRGDVNTSLLQRLLGINANILKRASHQYMSEAKMLVERAAADPTRATFGGLHTPTVVVSHPDGTNNRWIDELGLGETEHLESVLRAACYILIASLTGMRDSEIQELTRDSATTKDGINALRSVQHKGNDLVDGQRRTWWAPRPVIRTVEVLGGLAANETHLFARRKGNVGAYVPNRDIARLIAFVNDEPSERLGGGRGLGLEPITIPKGQAINATSLRRSFSVFATTRPGAELGLGIQLGHSAWRMTTGYMSDGQQQAVRLMDDERKRVLQTDVMALLQDDSPVAGPAAHHVTAFRAQIVSAPDRAERLATKLAGRLHLGLTNDCMWNPATSSCGGDRPKLGNHVCVGVDCTNALLRPEHVGVITGAIERIDAYLDQQRGHPMLVEQMRRDRANLARVRRELTSVDRSCEQFAADDVQEENESA
ncbi:hypothetical protein [Rhodococcus yananensis]|uniref:hypothetical protein n=1 Tax=Rhodococcus yananensis TaxID=2879464 RepID=UPI003EB9CE7C